MRSYAPIRAGWVEVAFELEAVREGVGAGESILVRMIFSFKGGGGVGGVDG